MLILEICSHLLRLDHSPAIQRLPMCALQFAHSSSVQPSPHDQACTSITFPSGSVRYAKVTVPAPCTSSDTASPRA
jgi:hypothetical protein